MKFLRVDEASKMPKVQHWAILKPFSASTSTYEANDGLVSGFHYEAYHDKGAWLSEIEHLEKCKLPYCAMKATPAKVTLNTSIDVKE